MSTIKFGFLLGVTSAIGLISGPAAAQSNRWLVAGGNIENTRTAEQGNGAIQPWRVGKLKQQWVFETKGDVSATPTVDGDDIFITDNNKAGTTEGGWVHRISRKTGKAIWSRKVSDITGRPNSWSRVSPALSDKALIIGDQASATLIALDRKTGATLWQTLLDTRFTAIITSSPTIYKGRIYVGVSSNDEGAALGGVTPGFRGSVAAVDLKTGALVWQTKTVPAGYTGGAVWGSSPAIDAKRNAVYVATGNNYSVPASVADCIRNTTDSAAQDACLAPDNYIDAILSLDLDTGAVNWGRRVEGPDAWLVSCIQSTGFEVTCPDPEGPDYDFGSAPNLFTIGKGNGKKSRDLVGVGQKSGIYWAFDRDTGEVVWKTQVGPGGTLGGIQWGSAVDGERIYVGISNNEHKPYSFPDGTPHNAGSWAALDPATGKVLWQVKVPGLDPNPFLPPIGLGALGLGFISSANGVVFAPSNGGQFVALDGKTGKTLWQFESGGTVIAGAAIAGNDVIWGSGYARFGLGKPNNKLYKFSIDD